MSAFSFSSIQNPHNLFEKVLHNLRAKYIYWKGKNEEVTQGLHERDLQSFSFVSIILVREV